MDALSVEVSGETEETPKENEHNVTSDTANLSMESNGSFPISSNPVLIPSEPDDPLDDADIDVAAEQIVKEFTEHLNQRATPGPPMTEANEGDDGEEGDCMGILSSTLAAGGFAELIVALDAPMTAPPPATHYDSMEVLVTDNTDDEEDIVEEEVDEVSYDEEEIMDESMTEIEFMDDVDIEEIMEDSGMIMAATQKTSDTVVEQSPTPAASMDAPAESQEAFDYSNDTMDAFATTTTVTTINSLNDSIAMDLSETTRNTAVEPLYGDVLLGDISEMTTGSKSGFYDPSVHSQIDASSYCAGTSSVPSDSPHSSVHSITTPPPLSEANRRSLQSSYDEVEAVAAAAAVSPNSAPVPPAMQGAPALTTTEPLEDPTVAPSLMSQTSNIVVPTEPTPYHPEYSVSSMNVPVPPALSGAPSETFADLETGKATTKEPDIQTKEPEMAQSFFVKDVAKEKKEQEEVEITEGMNLSIYGAGLLCLLVVFIAVILSVVLTRDSGSTDHSIPVPSPAPIAATPVVPTPVALVNRLLLVCCAFDIHMYN
jgi:hypothetical protein